MLRKRIRNISRRPFAPFPGRETACDGLFLFGQPGWSVCRPGVDAASLGEWLVGTPDAKFLLSCWHWQAISPTAREHRRWSWCWQVSSSSATAEHPLFRPKAGGSISRRLPADGSAELNDGSDRHSRSRRDGECEKGLTRKFVVAVEPLISSRRESGCLELPRGSKTRRLLGRNV